MASWHPHDSIEVGSSSEEEKIFAGNYMEVLQESYCSSDDDLDCKQSLSGQSRWCAHSAARLERGEINEKRLGERRKRKGLRC